MKFTQLIFGLLLATGATLFVGVPAQGEQFSTPSRKESPSLSDKGRGSSPDGPGTVSGHRSTLDDTVEIVGVTEQKPDASGRCKVTVRVRYALVHYPRGVLSLGFNLKSATSITRVTDRPVEAGTEEVELSATIIPVTWPDAQPFKLYVGLSAEPRPGQWSLLAAMTQMLKRTAAPAAGH
jgi:hypothetical protein